MAEHLPSSADDGSPISDDNRIKVVCRVRPPVMRETHGAKGLTNRCVEVGKDKRTIVISSRPQGKSFTFDYAAGEDSTQEELFAEVGQPVTEACLEGYNGTIFCYGQTGSGKTFTTFGPGAVMENHLNPGDPKSYALRGLVPRVLEYLYDTIKSRVDNGGGKVSYACRCSFYEIFNEKVFDLVDESNRDNPMGLSVREDTRKGVYVEGLMEEEVDSADSACEVLHRGFRNRHVGETAMNRESSRSHAVFTLVVKSTEVVEAEGLTRSRVARFNLVDLAGSERQKDTQTSGERLKEASNINKSLSTLGQVINALVEKSAGRFRHVHYRDSKLTFLLRDSLGGNSKTMLVAAVSPADQNFGETLSTLKFAQRAKMIKNQAVKNEDTSGSFDALRREVSSLRQQLAARLNEECTTGARATAGPGICAEFPVDAGPGMDGSSDVLLADALRRARAAEQAEAGARRRVESLLSTVERSEKDALQLKMVIKFRDGTIAAQRKKDADKERISLAEENAHLRKQLEEGVGESSEVTKWRLQCKEAEARLVELTGDRSGDAKRLVWGVADEERFRGDLDEKMLSLMEENRRLKEEAETFEERLLQETRIAEKRRLSAENRAEFEAKKIVEDALLSKLQEAQGRVEKTKAKLASSEAHVAELRTERAQQEAAISALTRKFQEANRRMTEAVRDRDVRLGDLQSKIEELSKAKERATEDSSGCEIAALELKLATAIKDNTELLRVNKALEEEADALDQDLERLEVGKKAQEEAVVAERAETAATVASLNHRMQQQEEAHEWETEELQAEKRSVMEDLEAATKRFMSIEKAHAREVGEQQRRNNDLQGCLAETRARVKESEGRLKQLRDDYDTLSEQARFSQHRVEELERSLDRTAGDLVDSRAHAESLENELLEAESEAECHAFFKLAQEQLTVRAQEMCSEREKTIELLEEELEAAKAYAVGVRLLLAGHESEDGGGTLTCVDAEVARTVGGVETAIVEARGASACAGMLSSMLEEHEGAVERIGELEGMVAELEEGRDRLEADVDYARREHQAVSETFEELKAVNACSQRDLESAQQVASRLESDIVEARSGAAEVEMRAKGLEGQLRKVRDSCFEYQARAVAAEDEVNTLSADVARLVEEVEQGTAATSEEARRAEEMAQAAAAREEALFAQVMAGEAAVAAKAEELAMSENALATKTKEASAKGQKLDEARQALGAVRAELERAVEAEVKAEMLTADVARLVEDVERGKVAASEAAQRADHAAEAATAREEALLSEVKAGEAAIFTNTQEAGAMSIKLAASEAALTNKVEEAKAKDERLAEAQQALQARKLELEAVRAELERARAEEMQKVQQLAASRLDAIKVGEELESTRKHLALVNGEATAQKEELVLTGRELATAGQKVGVLEGALEEARGRVEKAEEIEAELELTRGQLASVNMEVAAHKEGLVSTGKELAVAVEKIGVLEEERLHRLEDVAKTEAELELTRGQLAAVNTDAAAQKEELVSTGKELATALEKIGVLEGQAQHRVEEAAKTEAELELTRESLAAANMEAAVQKEERVSIGEELAAALEKVGVLEEALEEIEAELRASVLEGQERLSAEEARAKAVNARAEEAESLREQAVRASECVERRLQESEQKVAELREEARSTSVRLEESDAARSELVDRIVNLEGEIKRLGEAQLAEEERESLESEIELVRRELAETQDALKVTTTRAAALEEELSAIRGETEGYTAKVMELKDVNASLVGHKNTKQRIQQVQRLKDENNLLTSKVKELEDRLFAIKRQGCGPGCGKHGGGASAEVESSSGSVSSGASQHSMSPGQSGSRVMAYNLRRRAKTVDGPAAGVTRYAGGSVAATRGRRTGLRDMTNAR